MIPLCDKKLLVLLIGACGLMLSCSRGWHVTINGTANGMDFANAVTVDSFADVVAAGRTKNVGTGDDFTVVKLRGIDGNDF